MSSDQKKSRQIKDFVLAKSRYATIGPIVFCNKVAALVAKEKRIAADSARI